MLGKKYYQLHGQVREHIARVPVIEEPELIEPGRNTNMLILAQQRYVLAGIQEATGNAVEVLDVLLIDSASNGLATSSINDSQHSLLDTQKEQVSV